MQVRPATHPSLPRPQSRVPPHRGLSAWIGFVRVGASHRQNPTACSPSCLASFCLAPLAQHSGDLFLYLILPAQFSRGRKDSAKQVRWVVVTRWPPWMTQIQCGKRVARGPRTSCTVFHLTSAVCNIYFNIRQKLRNYTKYFHARHPESTT